MRLYFVLFFLGVIFGNISLAMADDAESIYNVIQNDDEDAFSNMVMLGYGIDQPDKNGDSPIMIATAFEKPYFVRFLIFNDANVNFRNNTGATPLHYAAQKGNIEIMSFLLEAGANINMPDINGDTPLIFAVKAKQIPAIDYLLEHEASLNFRNKNGESALKIADRLRLYDIGDYLRTKKAKY